MIRPKVIPPSWLELYAAATDALDVLLPGPKKDALVEALLAVDMAPDCVDLLRTTASNAADVEWVQRVESALGKKDGEGTDS
jgi:hypothetical protein